MRGGWKLLFSDFKMTKIFEELIRVRTNEYLERTKYLVFVTNIDGMNTLLL